jgi:hypothetical protein
MTTIITVKFTQAQRDLVENLLVEERRLAEIRSRDTTPRQQAQQEKRAAEIKEILLEIGERAQGSVSLFDMVDKSGLEAAAAACGFTEGSTAAFRNALREICVRPGLDLTVGAVARLHLEHTLSSIKR